jgi:hypothetical protein
VSSIRSARATLRSAFATASSMYKRLFGAVSFLISTLMRGRADFAITKSVWRDGTRAVLFEPEDFMARLLAQFQRRGFICCATSGFFRVIQHLVPCSTLLGWVEQQRLHRDFAVRLRFVVTILLKEFES